MAVCYQLTDPLKIFLFLRHTRFETANVVPTEYFCIYSPRSDQVFKTTMVIHASNFA